MDATQLAVDDGIRLGGMVEKEGAVLCSYCSCSEL